MLGVDDISEPGKEVTQTTWQPNSQFVNHLARPRVDDSPVFRKGSVADPTTKPLIEENVT